MDHSPLAKLAPEIRNRTYEHAMTEDIPLRIFQNFREPARLRVEAIRPQGLGMIGTCKQLRKECTQLYYAVNDFVLARCDTLEEFLKKIGKLNASALRSVTLTPIKIACFVADDGKVVLGPGKETVMAVRHLGNEHGLTTTKCGVDFLLKRGEGTCLRLDIIDLGHRWDMKDTSLAEMASNKEVDQDTRSTFAKIRKGVQSYRKMLAEI